MQHEYASLQQLGRSSDSRCCRGDALAQAKEMEWQREKTEQTLVEDASTSSQEHRTPSRAIIRVRVWRPVCGWAQSVLACVVGGRIGRSRVLLNAVVA